MSSKERGGIWCPIDRQMVKELRDIQQFMGYNNITGHVNFIIANQYLLDAGQGLSKEMVRDIERTRTLPSLSLRSKPNSVVDIDYIRYDIRTFPHIVDYYQTESKKLNLPTGHLLRYLIYKEIERINALIKEF